jgi:Ras-related protein Rab-1A
MNDEYFFKIILLGPSSTGAKTSLLLRIVDNTFLECQSCTIGMDYKIYSVKTKNGIAKLQIWDIPGQERFLIIGKNYYKSSDCIILGYDITDKRSFQSIKKEYYDSILDSLDVNQIKSPLIYLVANKIDLQDRIQVPDEEAISFANEKKIPYFKISAKTGEGVDCLINHITNSLIKRFSYNNIKQNKTITNDKKRKKNCY